MLLLSIAAASVYGIVAAVPTWVIKHTVDEIFINRYSHLILPFLGLFVLFFVLKGIFMYLTAYTMHWVGNRVINDIRRDLFSTMIQFPLSFYRKHSTGELMSLYINDIQMIQNASSAAVKNGIRSLFEASFLIVFAFVQNWKLALLLLVVGPAIGITIKKMGRAIKKASTSIQHDMASMSSMLQEIFVGIREIKAFNAEKFEVIRFDHKLKNCFKSIMANVKADSLLPALVEIIAMIGGSGVFYLATHQVLAGSITPGQLTSFIAAVLMAYQPLKRLVSSYSEVQYGLAAADKVFAMMDQKFQLDVGTFSLSSFGSSINLQNVSFSYDGKKNVLNNISLTIPKGACIGIMGASGGGKSTLCDLLLGFIQPTQGTILIDGHNLASVSPKSLRQKIGYVGQRTFLFNDTVKSNISYAMGEVHDAQIIRACKMAHAHEFIENLPKKYNSLVGENGGNISGGQKQRLTIARALLKDPEILIFDEVTSALDQASEEMIQLALRELRGNKTLIIVSHRPALLESVDTLLCLENGSIVPVSKDHL